MVLAKMHCQPRFTETDQCTSIDHSRNLERCRGCKPRAKSGCIVANERFRDVVQIEHCFEFVCHSNNSEAQKEWKRMSCWLIAPSA